ncbi:MAG: hypothetical protein QOG01_3623 [Pseudonocardiales bacterium]|jgi:transcriptional regulator with XRE-family HTH domain|nr:hypothetical protein [Pseudonocardiales bacterium]
MSDAWSGSLVAARHLLITQRLRQRRDDLGLTQKQIVTRLARCGMQTTNRALSSLEHGSGLDVAKLPELAIALDCTVTYLIGLTDDPHSWQPDTPAELPARRTADRVPGSSSVRPTSAPASGAPADGSWAQSLILGALIPENPRDRTGVTG